MDNEGKGLKLFLIHKSLHKKKITPTKGRKQSKKVQLIELYHIMDKNTITKRFLKPKTSWGCLFH